MLKKINHMKIDGRAIAQEIFTDLTKRVEKLKEKDIIPHLVIILVGSDPASAAYVKQKELKAESIGAKATTIHLPKEISQHELLATIQQWNNDNNTHGIIVQQPLPSHIDVKQITQAVAPQKDVDGFHTNSPFTLPLAEAVMKILQTVYKFESQISNLETNTNNQNTKHFEHSSLDIVSDLGFRDSDFLFWLTSKNVVVIGKGETGGGPIITTLKKLGVSPTIIDSKTTDPKSITKQADIIICAVGRGTTLTADQIKNGVTVISVGLHKGEDGKLHGDYEERDIEAIAAYYTPTPGGVGPVNVAMLLENVVTASEIVALS